MSNEQAFAELARLLFPGWMHEDEGRPHRHRTDIAEVCRPDGLVLALKAMAGREPDAFHYERAGGDQWSASFGGPFAAPAAAHPEGWKHAVTHAAIAHIR